MNHHDDGMLVWYEHTREVPSLWLSLSFKVSLSSSRDRIVSHDSPTFHVHLGSGLAYAKGGQFSATPLLLLVKNFSSSHCFVL
jgi:hypothetical protein